MLMMGFEPPLSPHQLAELSICSSSSKASSIDSRGKAPLKVPVTQNERILSKSILQPMDILDLFKPFPYSYITTY